jgi:hypothetical protein
MRWTLGLLLFAAAGCGYRQTKMVACPETGCAPDYASSSPQGLPAPRVVRPTAGEEMMPPVSPQAPLPDTTPPPPPLPEPAPTP